jgi:hypothetical protein
MGACQASTVNVRGHDHAGGVPDFVITWYNDIHANVFSKVKDAMRFAFAPSLSMATA